MKIIRGGRGARKTYSLIRESAKRNIPILCIGAFRVGYILSAATEMGMKIPEPLVVEIDKR